MESIECTALFQRLYLYIRLDILVHMNVIRALREQTGVTQQALAEKAGTSQPTIALYEAGRKSPTLATLQRLGAAMGLDMVVQFTPKMSREDQRSLAYHRAIAKCLEDNESAAREHARRLLLRMAKQNPGARALFEDWENWLNSNTEELISKILDPGIHARDMRQVSPFAGLIPPRERAAILARFRREYAE